MEDLESKASNYSTASTKAEISLEGSRYQQVSAHEDSLPNTDSLVRRVNGLLLKVCVLRVCELPQQGLELAGNALYIANLNNLQALGSKAQLFRGLCLFDLGLYADASWCFTRAASIHWVSRGVPALTEMAEDRRLALPEGSEGKQRSQNFQNTSITKGVRSFESGSS